LDNLNKKKPWLEFEEIRNQLKDKKDEHTKALADLVREQQSLGPLKQKIQDLKAGVTTTDKEMEKQTEQLKKMDQQRKAYLSKNDGLAEAAINKEDEKSKVQERYFSSFSSLTNFLF